LKYCRDIGSYVVVGLNSDDSVKRLKGNERPYFNEQDRKFLLESLSCVDEVHIFDEDTPYNIISKLKPDIIVKGGDYVPSEVVGNDISDVIIFNFVNGYSTTKILDKMK
jgi:D-beta-D-heptose 7-phosphate kinase/D-beta-D-heptose 1-phosphate adenosyltransferase